MPRMDYISTMQERQNRYADNLRKADEERARAGGPSKKECYYLQKAAEQCSSMSSISTGITRERYNQILRELNLRIRTIHQSLDGQEAKKTSGKPKGDSGENDKNSGDDEEGVSDKTVRSWFAEDPGYGFESVDGMKDTVQHMKRCISLTRHSTLRSYLRLSNTHSFLLYGPPGCGKTYLARAFAHELMQEDYKYMALVGADILSKYVGDAEKIVKRVFQEARKNAPCVIFVDEFDSVCRNRAKPNLPEYASSLTTAFLTGYNDIVERPKEEEAKPIIFIGATNYLDNVDHAMIDRMEQVLIPVPDQPARESAFRMRCTDRDREGMDLIQLEEGFTYGDMAEMTEGYNRRDINRLIQNVYSEIVDSVAVGGDEDMVEKMISGEFRLTHEKFLDSVTRYNESRVKDNGYEPPDYSGNTDFKEEDTDEEGDEELELPELPDLPDLPELPDGEEPGFDFGFEEPEPEQDQ